MRKIIIFLLCLFAVFPVLAQDAETGHMRIAHFSIDAGPVDVYVNGEAMEKDMSYPDVSSWAAMPAGTYSVAVTTAGGSMDDPLVGPTDVELGAGDWITVAVIGLQENGSMSIEPVVEDFSPIPDGTARISMLAAAPGITPVNIVANGEALATGLTYPHLYDPENTGFLTSDVVAQVYSIQIQDDSGNTVADVGSLNLGQHRNYLIAVIGTGSIPQFKVVTSDMDMLMAEPTQAVDLSQVDLGSGTMHMRIAHFAPGTPAVDVYINGELSDYKGLEFNGVTDWATVDAGVYNIAIAPAETSIDDAIIREDVPLATDTFITVAAIGTAEQDNAKLQLIEEDYSATAPQITRISVFNAIPDGTPVNLVANDNILIQTLGYPGYFEGEGDGFATVDVVAKEYAMQITLADGTEVADLGSLLLGAGRNYFVAVTGLASNPTYVIVRTDISDIGG